ncbi:MAG: hypothetical protein M3179_14200 [Actinomycetota bacterium]|nr:hypothetical protein [Actinomycetota bacterium]
MERTGTTPPGAVVAPDLAAVLEAAGPFVSLYLGTEADVENAAQRSETHWKSVRRDLSDAGANEAVLAEIDALVPDAHLHGQALAVIADQQRVLHVEHLPGPPPRDEWTLGPLPRLLPILEWRQWLVPHVTVLADRTGADLHVASRDRDVDRTVSGDDYPIGKPGAGGWSQRRYQERAENTWEQNADDVAKEIARLVDAFDARLVVAAGDVRAIELIRAALPDPLLERFEVVQAGRADDGSDDVFAARVEEQVRTVVEHDTARLLEKFREELGQDDRATDGPDDTLAALARAQVDVLLLADGVDDQRTAYFGPAPLHVAHLPETLRAMGVDQPQEALLVDVAVRAALGSGAGVRVVPDGDLPTGRIGALLRWS